MAGWTYGDTASNPSVSGNSGSGNVMYSYKVSGADDSTYISTKPSNAGTYVVMAQITETNNYNGATITNSFTISKANLSASVSMSGWTYGGTVTNPSVSGNTGGGSVSYTYKVNGAADSTYTSTKPSDAGTYVVRAVIDATTNYNGTTVTNTFTIAKINPTYTAPTAKSLKYNGSAQVLLNAGSTNIGTMQYSSDNSSWSTTIPSQTNAGTYTVYWRIVSGNNNYNDIDPISISVEIEELIEGVFAVTTTGKEVR
jgi:hypothetical protein